VTTRPIGIPIESEDQSARGIGAVEKRVDDLADSIERDMARATGATDKLTGGIRDAGETAETAMARASGATGGFRDQLGSVGNVLGLGFAGGVGVAAGAVGAFVGELLRTADELDTLSNISGASAEALQEWGYIARESGGSAEDVADAFREMQLRISEAAALGSGPAVDALDLIGVSLEHLRGLRPDQQFEILRDAIASVEDPAQRLFAAEELLGGASERLTAVLSATGDEFARVREEAQRLGVQLSNEEVDRLDEYEKKLERTQDALRKTGTDFLFFGADVLEFVGHQIIDLGETFGVITEASDELIEATEEQIAAWEAEAAASTVAAYGLYEAAQAAADATPQLSQFAVTTLQAADAQYQLGVQSIQTAAAIRQANQLANEVGPLGQYGLTAETSAGLNVNRIIAQLNRPGGLRTPAELGAAVPSGTGRAGGGARGGGGGPRSSARESRPPRLRFGDYLVAEEGYTQDELDFIRRYGPRDQYGPNQRINLSQDISGLGAGDFQALLDQFSAQYGIAVDNFAEDQRRRGIEDAARRERELAKMIGQEVAVELDRNRPPCPPVTFRGSLITERDVAATISAIQERVAPKVRSNPISGATGT